MGCDMWFGTKDYSTYVPTPVSGADVSSEGWGESGTTLNGSGFVMNSFNSHKTYDFSWRQSTARETAQLIKSFYDGSYGRGKLYLVDPLTLTTNILPARWADPSITCDFEGPQLVPGVDPRPIITSGFEKNKLPVRSAQFDLSGVQPVVNTDFVVEATNYATNPNLVGDGTWSEVRRNFFQDPMITSLSGWTPGGHTATLTGDGGLRLVRSSGIANTLVPNQNQFTGLSGVLSTGYLVRNQASSSVDLRIALWDSVAYSYGPTITVPAGESRVVSYEGFTVPSGTTYAQPRLHQVGIMSQPVDFVVSQPRYNPGALLQSFFNPSAPTGSIDPDMRQRWLGPVNASASVMEIENVRGFTAFKCIMGVSTRNGKPAARMIATSPHTGASSDSHSYAQFSIPTGARSGGVLVGTRHQDAIISPPRTDSYNGLRVNSPIQWNASNVVGSTPMRLEYNALTSAYTANIGHGGVLGSPDVWWTDINLYTSGYSGPDFNGGTQVPGKITRWAGEPGASISEIGTLRATSTPNLDDDRAVFIPIPDGMQLNLGAFYEASSANAGVWVSRVAQGGIVTQDLTRLEPLDTTSDTLFPDVITKTPGTVGVYLWIGKIAAESAIVAVRGIHARLSPVGKAPGGVNYWLGGQGNAGVRFIGPPSYINHTGVNGGQVECAASFKESIF